MLKIMHAAANTRSKNGTERRSIARLIEIEKMGSALYNAIDVVYTLNFHIHIYIPPLNAVLHLNFPLK